MNQSKVKIQRFIDQSVVGKTLDNVEKRIIQRIREQILDGHPFELIKGKYRTGLTMDKGGEHVVFGILLGSCKKISSPDVILIAGILKGDKSYKKFAFTQTSV